MIYVVNEKAARGCDAMSNYVYLNDYEREETQKYEGIYTSKEIELNKRLFDECSKEHIDFIAVEELLKQGADPLGGTELFGWDLLDHIYGNIVGGSQDFNSAELPQLTELFLKYGMNVDAPKIPYDGKNSLNPLWEYAFVTNENAIRALKMLLDHGLSADSFAEFWDHSMIDYFHCACGDPQNDDFWNYNCTWTFKMLLLGASYDHILNNDKILREFICCDFNSYDVHNFRSWDEYDYYFNTSYCSGDPELYGAVIQIYEKKAGTKVWEIGVGADGRKALSCMRNK